jgi:hypothetical protein
MTVKLKLKAANDVILTAYVEMRRVAMENRVFSTTQYNDKIPLDKLTTDNVLEAQAFDVGLENSLLTLSEYISINKLSPTSSAQEAAQTAIDTYKERVAKKKATNKAALV